MLRKRENPILRDNFTFPSCFRNGNVDSCFRHVYVSGFVLLLVSVTFLQTDFRCRLFPLRFCKRISNVFVASDGSIHLIPKWQQIHYSFVFILTDPRCLDRIWRIQKNHWLKTGTEGQVRYMNFLSESKPISLFLRQVL